MLETFNVLRIDEPDFGWLYERDINEGDKVFLIEGEMRKLR